MNLGWLHLDPIAVVVLALVTAQRLTELVYARFNEERLKKAGAVEHGASHFPLIVALHAAWLAGLVLAVWLMQRRSLLALAMPPAALAFWFATLTLGERLFDWTA